jgi:thiol-disulfide isomerase/thioredoxin
MNDSPAPQVPSRSRSTGAVVAIVVAIGAATGFFSQRHLSRPAAPKTPPTTAIPAPAPPTGPSADAGRKVPEVLPAFTLNDRDGQPRRLADWKGRPLVVNFWATWCAPCRREIPLLNAARAAGKGMKLEIVGIAVDFREDVLAYLKEHPVHYPLLIGEEDGLEALKSVGMTPAFPFTLFADSQQRIVALKVGELHQDELDLILTEVQGVDSGQRDLPAARARIAEGLKELATKRALTGADDAEKTS